MPDLATLELRVSGAPATQTVKQFGDAAERTATQATALEKATLRQANEFSRMQNITVASTRNMDAFSALQAEAAGHVGEHSLSVGRLERSMAMLTERVFGLNPQLVLLGESLAHFAIGSVEMVAVLGALALMAKAWELISENSKKAGEEQEKAIDRLKRLQHEQLYGKFGDTPEAVVSVMRQVQAIRDRIAAITPLLEDPQNRAKFQSEINDLREQEKAKLALIQAGENDILEVFHKNTDEAKKKADEAEKKRVEAITKGYREQLAATEAGLRENTRAFLEWQKNHPTDTRFFVDKQEDKRDMEELAKASEEAWKRDGEAIKKTMEDADRAQKKTMEDMTRSLAQFFDDVMVKGHESFRQLFDDIGTMFEKMVARMAAQDLAKAVIGGGSGGGSSSGLLSSLSGLLGLAGAGGSGAGMGLSNAGMLGASISSALPFAAVGGMAGFLTGGMGHQSGGQGALSGAAGGAATGALLGSVVPVVGTLVGGIIGGAAGLVAGFLGAKHGAEAAAEALRKIQENETQVAGTLANWRAQITGTAADQKAAALLNIKLQYMQITAQIEQLEAGKKMEAQRNKDLAEASDLYAQALKKAGNAADSLSSSMLNLVQGYKYQAAIYAASSSSTSGALGGTTTTTARGDLSVNVVIDGQVIGKAVLKNFKAKAAQQFRDTTRWADIQ